MSTKTESFTFAGRLMRTDAAGGQGTGVSLGGASFEVDVAHLHPEFLVEGQFHAAGWFEQRDYPTGRRILTFVAKDPTGGLKVEKEFDGFLKRIDGLGAETTGWRMTGVTIEVDLAAVRGRPEPLGQTVEVTGRFEPRTYPGRRVTWTLVAAAAADAATASAVCPGAPTIAAIAADPRAFGGRTLTLGVRFFGWSQPPDIPAYGDLNATEDWAVADATGWCNVHGQPPFPIADAGFAGQPVLLDVFVESRADGFLLWRQPTIFDIAKNPGAFADVAIPLRGEFWGQDFAQTPASRFFGEPLQHGAWRFADATGSCPVCGHAPFSLYDSENRGRPVEFVAAVVPHKNSFCLAVGKARPAD